MKLPKYFFAESSELPGAGFIIATDSPCIVGKVLKFNKPEDFEIFNLKSEKHSIVSDYMIAIQYFDVIGDNKSVDPDDLDVCLKQMADTYLKEKILVNERYFRRNKI